MIIIVVVCLPMIRVAQFLARAAYKIGNKDFDYLILK